jgi:hypothetical protein
MLTIVPITLFREFVKRKFILKIVQKIKIKHKVNVDKENFLHFQFMHEFQNTIFLFMCLTSVPDDGCTI